jgi:iron complex transport system ATP-binding protein
VTNDREHPGGAGVEALEDALPGAGAAPTHVFRIRGVDFTYPGAPEAALTGVDLAVSRGEVVGILGPNGSGKSTLLRVLLGVLHPQAGEVTHDGRPLESFSRRELARRVGVVSQGEDAPFPTTVREFVGMGRYPHLGLWRAEGSADREAIHRAMARCGVEALARRGVDSLSGGERQRVRIARALAQEPTALVLDEPTAALDIRYEMAIFELLATLAREDGVTVVLVTHHLNLAARYASGLLLLDRGRAVRRGSPEDVLQADLLTEIYGWPVAVAPHPGPGRDRGAPQVIPLAGGRQEG